MTTLPLVRSPLGAGEDGGPERHEPGDVDPVLLAFALWDDDCAIFAAAHGTSLEVAADRLRSQREIGRTAISDER